MQYREGNVLPGDRLVIVLPDGTEATIQATPDGSTHARIAIGAPRGLAIAREDSRHQHRPQGAKP